jgi:hypothetical protein
MCSSCNSVDVPIEVAKQHAHNPTLLGTTKPGARVPPHALQHLKADVLLS